MVLRFPLRAACAAAVLGSAAALGLIAVPATAQLAGGPAGGTGTSAGPASTPGWRIIRQLGSPDHTTTLFSVSATGARDAWAAGNCCAQGQLLVERWNGTSWRRAALPAGIAALGEHESTFAVGASSASNAWIFLGGVLGGDPPGGPVVVRWNGKAWTSTRLPTWVERLTGAAELDEVPAVFGPRDVWDFSLGAFNNPALAAHFDGHAWRKLFLPGEPDAVSALAANDIWAEGLSRKTMNSDHPVNIVMHWNGRAWRTMRLPIAAETTTGKDRLAGLAALNPRDVWVGVVTSPLAKPSRTLLLHWNGKRWNRVSTPRTGLSGPVVQDGHGGLWLMGGSSTPPFPVFMYHYSNGRFTRQRMPHGNRLGLRAFEWIPGTRSVWAVGNSALGPGPDLRAVIVKDGR
jgi:hypothetical protein